MSQELCGAMEAFSGLSMIPVQVDGLHKAPFSADECELVRSELRAIITSTYFRNSKRYPAFLTYVVEKTILGEVTDIKERTIGIEVFGRPADYDTNTDPTVRNTASEVRKRLALYHAETLSNTAVEIHLPLGSYHPEIRLKSNDPAAANENAASASQHLAEPLPALEPGTPAAEEARAIAGSAKSRVKWLWWAVPLFFAVVGAGIWLLLGRTQKNSQEKLWYGFLKPGQTVLIVIPQAPSPKTLNHLFIQGTPKKEDLSGWIKDNPDVAAEDVSAIIHASQPLMEHDVPFHFRMDSGITLTDLRDRPIILIGGPSNLWTMKLLAPLRFHFSEEGGTRIEDTQGLLSHKWAYVLGKTDNSPSTVVEDCAIVARFHDPTTGGSVMILAGAGRNGTEAAGEFVTSNSLLDDLNKRLPRGWENRNLEVVLKTKVIDGKTGSPSIEATDLW